MLEKINFLQNVIVMIFSNFAAEFLEKLANLDQKRNVCLVMVDLTIRNGKKRI